MAGDESTVVMTVVRRNGEEHEAELRSLFCTHVFLGVFAAQLRNCGSATFRSRYVTTCLNEDYKCSAVIRWDDSISCLQRICSSTVTTVASDATIRMTIQLFAIGPAKQRRKWHSATLLFSGSKIVVKTLVVKMMT